MSNHLDPDQARQNVGPDLGPNCKVYQQAALIGKELTVFIAQETLGLIMEEITQSHTADQQVNNLLTS